MKIAVLNNWVPFVRGGAEILADALVEALNTRGHEAQLVRIPFRWDTPETVVSSMITAASLRLIYVDRVVPLKFPCWLVPHPDKVPWLLHQYRQVYDLVPDVGTDDDMTPLQRTVRRADNQAFAACGRIHCNSGVTAERLLRHNGYHAHVLHPPLEDVGQFRTEPAERYLLCLGRITGGKRQTLAVQAMQHAPSDLRLVVAGQPETAGDLAALHQAIEQSCVGDRVTVIPRFISEREKVDLLARCLASVYVPIDEDSYGYATIEAFAAAKPVITVSDSGGVLDVVEHRSTGLVSDPDAGSLGNAYAEMSRSVQEAAELGRRGRARLDAMDLSWDRVVSTLTR